jgi:hypothetical protein
MLCSIVTDFNLTGIAWRKESRMFRTYLTVLKIASIYISNLLNKNRAMPNPNYFLPNPKPSLQGETGAMIEQI